MRPIDADAAATRITEDLELVMGEDQFGTETIAALIRNALKSERITPTIQAGRRGSWVKDDVFKTLYRCSRCRGGAPITIEFMSNMLTKFCPYCGAEMENREDGEGQMAE